NNEDRQAEKDQDDNDDQSAANHEEDAPPVKTHKLSKAQKAQEEKPSPAQPKVSKSRSGDEPAPTGNWWHPKPGNNWHSQYVGKINMNEKVTAYDIDLFDTDGKTIEALHGGGVKVVCYFSAGSYEGWRPDVKRFPASVLGRGLTGWKYEK